MIVECKKCGAPLEVTPRSAFAQCSYCGNANKVKSARTLMAERPPGWAPPPVWTPPAAAEAESAPLAYRPPTTQPLRKRSGLGSVFRSALRLAVPIGVLLVGGVVAYYYSGAGGLPFVGIDESGEPRLGVVDLDAVSNVPTVLQGGAESDWSVDHLGSACRGSVGRLPHVLLRASQEVSVRLDVTTEVDLVMVVRTADGEWLCDDDSGSGMAPAITANLGPGDHRVWVGAFSSARGGLFSLTVTSQTTGGTQPVGGLLIEGPPSLGVVAVGEGAIHGLWDGSTAPFTEVSTLGPGCGGFVPMAPHVLLESTMPRAVRIETAQSNVDLVLVVRTPSGRFICDDDSGEGLNPRVELGTEIGRSAVWVGTYHNDGIANFSLEVTEPGARRSTTGAVIAPSEAPTLGYLDLDSPEWAPVYEGRTRADLDAHTLAPDCRGWVGVAPDLVVLTTVSREMEITTSSRADTTLIVRGPDGSFVCDDDSGERNNPRVHQLWIAGPHQVWVGSIRRRAAPYQLVVTETPL